MNSEVEKWTVVLTDYNLPSYGMIVEREYLSNPLNKELLGAQSPSAEVAKWLQRSGGDCLRVERMPKLPVEFDYASLFEARYIPFFDSFLIGDRDVERKVANDSESLLTKRMVDFCKGRNPFVLVAPDHSAGLAGFLSSIGLFPDMALFVFDRHLDIGELRPHDPVTRGNFLTRISVASPKSDIVVAAPSSGANLTQIGKYRRQGYRIIQPHKTEGATVRTVVEEAERIERRGIDSVHISIDLDSIKEAKSVYFSDGVAPFSLLGVETCVKEIKRKFRVVSADITEYHPTYLETTWASEKGTLKCIQSLVENLALGN